MPKYRHTPRLRVERRLLVERFLAGFEETCGTAGEARAAPRRARATARGARFLRAERVVADQYRVKLTSDGRARG